MYFRLVSEWCQSNFGASMHTFTHWLPELFAKKAFLDIMEILRLDMGEISSNLLKKAFATWQHAFLCTGVAFYDIFARVEIKIVLK